ncbi:hypothetical protein F5Y04DRAFT_277288 [Hypomontagnella monticulosa]|nr:hypothetical protein F5Y04DRAFT_277288 [Hypomontagnella monticulosa]
MAGRIGLSHHNGAFCRDIAQNLTRKYYYIGLEAVSLANRAKAPPLPRAFRCVLDMIPCFLVGYIQAPGKRCPTCQGKGQEVWVLPGRDCPYCGTYVA